MSKISELMAARQATLRSKLAEGSQFTQPTAVGDVSELNWKAMLDAFLPGRYQVSRGSFIIDSEGKEAETSEQDIVIHDSYFHPQIFETEGRKFIPAESVYAVFEVKQEIRKDFIEQAQRKAREVRDLKRVSGVIQHAGGAYTEVREPLRIISGILADRSGWSDLFGAHLRDALSQDQDRGAVDFGYAAEHGAFLVRYEDGAVSLAVEREDRGLLFFLTRLYAELVDLGSVPKLDILAYDRESEAAPIQGSGPDRG